MKSAHFGAHDWLSELKIGNEIAASMQIIGTENLLV